MSSPFLSSRASTISCASSSAFRYHLYLCLPLRKPFSQELLWNSVASFFNGAEYNRVYTEPVGFRSLLNSCTEFTLAVPSESICDFSRARRIICCSVRGTFCLTRPIVRCGEKPRSSDYSQVGVRRISLHAGAPPTQPGPGFRYR